MNYYLETDSVNPYYNLAFEEYILLNKKEGDFLMLWQNDKTIVIGQNQNTEEEINKKYVLDNGINIVRRNTGGGAVYHDLGNLNYSFITDLKNAEELTIEKFTKPIVEFLHSLGLNAELSGRNDILIDGLKVSGVAQRVVDKRILHHGTLLFDSNLDAIGLALNTDVDKFSSKSTKSVRSRVCNINNFLNEKISINEFWLRLKDFLLRTSYSTLILSDNEIAKINEIKHSKYDTWEWNYGRSPAFNVSNKRRWSAGTLETKLSISHGKIDNIRFFGDFLGVYSTEHICNYLKGCRYIKEEVYNVLSCINIDLYFGGITHEELIKTIFDE